LGDWFSVSRKGAWDRGRWVSIYTQRVKTTWLCVGLAIKIPPSRAIVQMVLETVITPHRANVQVGIAG